MSVLEGSKPEAQFILVVQGHGIALDRALIVGRGEDVDIPLDDGTASRRHAVLSPACGGAFVEDLGSTNGTMVNGTLVVGERRLDNGDTIRVGETELTLLAMRDGQDSIVMEGGMAPDLALELEGTLAPETIPRNVFEILAEAAFEALALGNPRRAEYIVGRRLVRLLADARGGAVREDHVDAAIELSLALAQHSSDARWIDICVELHECAERPMSSTVIDTLYDLAETVRGINPRVLERYCSRMEYLGPRLDRAAQFSAKRVYALLPLIRF